MNTLSMTIQRFVGDHFPGFVECLIVDTDGCSHLFVEKEPIVSVANLSSDSAMPQPCHIACLVEDEWTDDLGRMLVRVRTDAPWDIASVEGKTSFIVLGEQVLRG